MSLTDVPEQPGPSPQSRLRAILPYTSVLVILAALYAAYTVYSRYQDSRDAQKEALAKKEERANADKRVIDQLYGSGEVKITTFAADNGVLTKGETTQLCYGALNAQSVKVDPPLSEPTKPTFRHCTEIAPKKTTTYTLTAEDAAGHTKTVSLTIQVR